MTSFLMPTCFNFINEKLYFCPYIAESANMAKNAQSFQKIKKRRLMIPKILVQNK
jgi:hypothetical protein